MVFVLTGRPRDNRRKHASGVENRRVERKLRMLSVRFAYFGNQGSRPLWCPPPGCATSPAAASVVSAVLHSRLAAGRAEEDRSTLAIRKCRRSLIAEDKKPPCLWERDYCLIWHSMQRCLLLGRHARTPDPQNTPPSSLSLLDAMPDDQPNPLPSSSATAIPRQKQHRPSSSNIRSRTSPPPSEQDARPPTKRARKAINCEPCRNSKLKCDRSDLPWLPSPP